MKARHIARTPCDGIELPRIAHDQEQRFLADAEPLGSHPYLRRGLLGRGIEDLAFLRREATRRLKEEGGLADPGLSSEQHDRARHEAAPEHPVEAWHPRPGAGLAHWRADGRGSGQRLLGGNRRLPTDFLHVAVPLAALGAPAEPLGRRRSAGLTGKDGGDAGRHSIYGFIGMLPSRYLMSSSLHRSPAPKKSESAPRE